MRRVFKSLAWFIAYVGLMLTAIVVYSTTFPPGGGMDSRLILSDEVVQLICQLDAGIRYGLSIVFTMGAVTILVSEKIAGRG